MSNYSPRPRPLPSKKVSEAEALKLFMQKRALLAENILCSLCSGKSSNKDYLLPLVDVAVEMADRMMQKLYGGKEAEKEKEEVE